MNCPKCGNPLDPSMKFCAKCGAPSPQQPVQQRPAPQVTSQQEPASVKKAKKNAGKNNLAVKIVAIVLAVAVIVGGGVFAAIKFADKSKGNSDDAGKTDVAVQNASVGGTGIRVVSKVSNVDENGKATSWNVYSYNKWGLVSEESTCAEGYGEALRYVYGYDENGNKSTLTMKNGEESNVLSIYDSQGLEIPNDNFVYEYDSDKNIISATCYYKDGNVQSKHEYVYDSDNHRIQRTFTNYPESYYENASDAYPNVNITMYDGDGRITEEKRIKYNGKYGDTKYTFKYNANGDLTEKIKYENYGPDEEYNELIRWTIEYDSNNNMISASIFESDTGAVTYEYTFTYDENGNMTEITEKSMNDEGKGVQLNKTIEYTEISVDSAASKDKIYAEQKDMLFHTLPPAFWS